MEAEWAWVVFYLTIIRPMAIVCGLPGIVSGARHIASFYITVCYDDWQFLLGSKLVVAKKVSKKAGSPKKRAKVSKAKPKSKVKSKAKAKVTGKSKSKSAKALKKASKKVSKKVSKKKPVKSKSVLAKRSKPAKSSAKKKLLGVISTGAGAKLAGKVGSAPPVAKAASARKRRQKSSPLRPEELSEFRALLLLRRRELLDSVGRMRAEALEKNRQDAAGNLSKFPTNPADLGSDNYELEFTLSLLEGERELLNEIDSALKRIDQGVYGICEATGQAITRDRLEFKPWARYTIEYANLLEKGLVSADSSESTGSGQ